jgi:hypothetical protein
MFVLSQNRTTIILGPMEYSKRYFQSVIKEDLDLDVSLPPSVNDYLDLGNSLEIFPVTIVYPTYNPTIEQLSGPFFDYTGQTATATYTAVPKNIEAVKNELKAKLAAIRYSKEVGGVKLTIQGTEVTALTGREDRNLYLQALQLGAANISWKFDGNTWLTLSLTELGDIVAAVMGHVKNVFETESTKATEIDNCTTLEQLLLVEIESPVSPI